MTHMHFTVTRIRSISQRAYYVAFVLYAAFIWIPRINWPSSMLAFLPIAMDVLRIVTVLLLAFRYLFLELNVRGYILTALLAVAGFLTWNVSGESWLFWMVLFLVTAQAVDYRLLAKLNLYVSSFLLISVPLLSAISIIPNKKMVTHSGLIRFSLGFTHPNFIGLLVLLIGVSLSVVLMREHLWVCIAVIMMLTVGNYSLSYSRSSIVISFVLVALLLIFTFVTNQRAQRIINVILVCAVVGCISLSYYSMIFYDANSEVWRAMNGMLSGRLSLAHQYYSMYSITLFGRNYSTYTPFITDFAGRPVDFLVDNAYAHLLLRYGLIPTLLFLAAYLAVLIKLIRRSNSGNEVFLVLIVFAFYALVETYGFRIVSNYMLVALATQLLFSNSRLLKKSYYLPA